MSMNDEKEAELAKLQRLVQPHPLYKNIPINLQANPHIRNTLIKYDKTQFPEERRVLNLLKMKNLNVIKPNIRKGVDDMIEHHFYGQKKKKPKFKKLTQEDIFKEIALHTEEKSRMWVI